MSPVTESSPAHPGRAEESAPLRPTSPLGIAATFIGTTIGAGYASGNEILQYFVSFGLWGGTGALVIAGALFFLLAVDVLEWSSPVRQNVLAHPQNRVALAYERATGKSFPDPMQNRPFLYDAEEEREPHACFQPEDCPEGVPWVFALHIMIPGPPHLGFVAYYTPVDPEWHKRDSPFARVARPFFFGGDPEYCDNHFKLIPKIVEGNFVVRRVVGSTPAVLGTKLKQYYHAAPHYFELDVDIGSSSVAAGVVRVSLGYAAAMTVDMAFVLEGKREQELPETVMGCVRCRGMELEKATFVE